jgi:hypothetical protein
MHVKQKSVVCMFPILPFILEQWSVLKGKIGNIGHCTSNDRCTLNGWETEEKQQAAKSKRISKKLVRYGKRQGFLLLQMHANSYILVPEHGL